MGRLYRPRPHHESGTDFVLVSLHASLESVVAAADPVNVAVGHISRRYPDFAYLSV